MAHVWKLQEKKIVSFIKVPKEKEQATQWYTWRPKDSPH